MKSYTDRFYRDMVEDNDIFDFGTEDYVSDSSPSTDDGEFGSED